MLIARDNARKFYAPNNVDLLHLSADFVGDAFRLLVLLQFHFHFDEHIHSLHIFESTAPYRLSTTARQAMPNHYTQAAILKMMCKICSKRKGKRACPAVGGIICAICCGTEREVTLSCPFDCEYLREAHKREKPLAVADRDIAYAELQVSEEFLAQHEEVLLFTIYSLWQAAMRTSGAVDSDVMAALEAAVQTTRTAQSGLVYETRAENMIAAAVQRQLGNSLNGYRDLCEQQDGLSPLRDSAVLNILVFLQRVGQQNQNSRPRGRRFIGVLQQMTPDTAQDPEASPKIIV